MSSSSKSPLCGMLKVGKTFFIRVKSGTWYFYVWHYIRHKEIIKSKILWLRIVKFIRKIIYVQFPPKNLKIDFGNPDGDFFFLYVILNHIRIKKTIQKTYFICQVINLKRLSRYLIFKLTNPQLKFFWRTELNSWAKTCIVDDSIQHMISISMHVYISIYLA